MKGLNPYLQPYYRRMLVGLMIKFAGTIMDLLLPWILAHIIDEIVPLEDGKLILLWGGMMIVCSGVAITGNIIANRMASRVSRDATERIRHDLFTKISYLSCSQMDGFSIPSLVSRMTTDTYNVHHMIGMMQRLGVRAPILLLGGLIVTMTLEPILTLVLLAILPFIMLVIFFVSKKGIPLFHMLQKSIDEMVRVVRENAQGIRIIKALSRDDYERSRFDNFNQKVVEREKKASLMMAVTNPLMNLFLNIGLVLVILIGAYRVNEGISQTGKIISFLSYFTIILNAMMTVTRLFVLYSKGTASMARINEVLAAPDELLVLAPTVAAVEPNQGDNHVLFQNVSFSYHKQKDDIEDISFALKEGETLGIIGPTGSGKTTIVRLLMRFYDRDEGCIQIRGEDIRSIGKERLYQMFGVAFQKDILFADEIGENIRFGRDITNNDIITAARHSQAEAFILEKNQGFAHRLVARGMNLSGGQKQRLLIARALASKPEILILDDSSSALDYRTDGKLRNALKEHYSKTTKIIIAQRISSIMEADHILVLEEGQMIGYGNHEELLIACENYQMIYQNQMGGEGIA